MHNNANWKLTFIQYLDITTSVNNLINFFLEACSSPYEDSLAACLL